MSGASTGSIVVKLGGRTQNDPRLVQALAALYASFNGASSARRDVTPDAVLDATLGSDAPGRLIIVHGGGDQISALQRMRGEEPVFVGGRRVTTDLALELVRMVLSGLANKQLVSALCAAGVRAVGISGEDAGLLQATPIDAATFGHSGTPTRVDVALLDTLQAGGFVPVVSPVAANASSSGSAGALNVNGDDAAAALAAAVQASELFLLADVPGVLDGDKQLISTLTLDDARALVASGVAGGGMAAKLDACAQALAGGVTRVRIGDIDALGNRSGGTSIVPALHATLSGP